MGRNIDLWPFGRKDAVSSGQLTRPSQAQGPYTSVFEGWIARKVQPSLYEAMREAIPVLDVAIHRLVTLDGSLKFEGKNKGLIHEIEDFAGEVKVNDMQTGLQAFVNNFSNETYEQGFSISEFVPSKAMDDIERLLCADSKDILFYRNGEKLETWYKGQSINTKTNDASELVGDILKGNLDVSAAISRLTAGGYKKLKPDNLIYYSIDNENHNPYGVSMMRSTEFVSKILLTIQNGLYNSWERFGDPCFELTYKTTVRDEEKLKARQKKLADNLKEVIDAKRAGQSADFVTAIDKDSELKIAVIGHDNQVLEVEMPARHVLEQIVARTRLPAWMLGMHWSTTERLAKYEAEMILSEAEMRSNNKMPQIKRIVATMLRLRGRTWKRGDWDVTAEFPNLSDLVAKAQARFLNAQADMYDRDDKQKPDEAKGSKGAAIKVEGHGKGCCSGTKEARPISHPELDALEDEFLENMADRTKALEERVLAILKLQDVKASSKASDEDPSGEDKDKVGFTVEQQAEIDRSIDDFAAALNPAIEGEGTLAYYYGGAYSLGTIQAAQMTGAAQPVLNFLTQKDVIQLLIEAGFKRVKANLKLLKKNIIAEMTAQVLAGANPRHIAYRLSGIFKDANKNWERLVRTEMTMAAERAKLDEFKAEEVERVEFVAAFDACPLCKSTAGIYEIDKAPVPAEDTHPRCYCVLATVIV